MEKINEKRLSVLKVALELLKHVQELQELKVKLVPIESSDKIEMSLGTVRELENGECLEEGFQTVMDSISYTINHLGKPFESTNLSEELENLKKENIEIALDKILEIFELIRKGAVTRVSDFSDYTRILWMLRKDLRG